jgi:hypothetical protein
LSCYILLHQNEDEEEFPFPLPATPLETLPGFDLTAGTTWIYPVNYPLR